MNKKYGKYGENPEPDDWRTFILVVVIGIVCWVGIGIGIGYLIWHR